MKNKSIVAKVGKDKITFKEFEQSFALEPKYAIRTSIKKARLSQINYLIEQKYYYLSAAKVGLESDSLIQRRINYIKENEVIKAYINKEFLDRVKISDEKLISALLKMDKKIKVQHLFATSKDEIKKIDLRLKSGDSFAKIAKEIFSDENLKYSGGDLGFINFGDLDPALENKIFSMKIGEISDPIESAYGFHILRVTDIQTNENFINLGNPEKVQLCTEILKNRKVDAIFKEHLSELAGKQKIKINNKVLNVLINATHKTIGKNYEQPGLFKPSIKTSDLNSIEIGLKDVRNDVLVNFGDQEIKVIDFLDYLKDMPPFYRPDLKTRNRMIQAIIDMIRSNLVLEEAFKKGIAQDKEVKKNYQKIIDDFLASEFQKRLYSPGFKEENPITWAKYEKTYTEIKSKVSSKIYENNLFVDVAEPDSLMAPDPIPVFLKNTYIW
ncbi:MAG: peptidylprolyl isomerase [Candidatus Thorarchaeota archaeon]